MTNRARSARSLSDLQAILRDRMAQQVAGMEAHQADLVAAQKDMIESLNRLGELYGAAPAPAARSLLAVDRQLARMQHAIEAQRRAALAQSTKAGVAERMADRIEREQRRDEARRDLAALIEAELGAIKLRST